MDQLRSISLLLVSGYFGNPASSFGHSLIRLNTEDGLASDGLIDLGINFGALVPENEWAPVYVVRGLLGGYEAGFSGQPYYTHDRVYSRTEFRDIWDHELALDDHEQLLLVYHLWEIAGKKFTYFFLKQNCAYRMAELLALVRNDDRLLARSQAWYAPVELFHRLHEAQREGSRPWVRAVRFIPSAERVVRHQFERLQPHEAALAHRILAEAPDDPLSQLGVHALPEGELVVLDTALHADAKGRVQLDRVDLIRAKKLTAMHTDLPGESRLSWQIALGAQRETAAGRHTLRALATFGAGYATAWGTAITAYAMMDGLLLSAPSRAALEPQVGLVMRAGRWKTWTRFGARRESGTGRWAARHRTEATYRLTADRAVRVELSREPTTRTVMSLIQYW